MISATEQRIPRTASWAAAVFVLLLGLLIGAGTSYAQDQEQLRDYIERTSELMDWARELVQDTDNARSRTVLAEAQRLQVRSIELATQNRPLRAYETARRAREAIWLAVRLAREAMNQEEQLRVRADRFREVFDEVRERAQEAHHETALTILRQSETQAERARERYLQGDAKAGVELLEQAEQLLQRARRLLQDAPRPGRMENEIERTRKLIEGARERLGDDAGRESLERLDDARNFLNRAASQLAQGHPQRARHALERSRQLIGEAVDSGVAPDAEAIRRQIERWDARATRLDPLLEGSNSDRAHRTFRRAGEDRSDAATHLAAGRLLRALRQIRAAHEKLDQVERMLR